MGIKREDGTLEDPCLAKVKPGEPFFVLRAQDLSAPNTIRRWTMQNMDTLATTKVVEAFECAAAMEKWAKEHGGKKPD